jgi:hypothetical protein
MDLRQSQVESRRIHALDRSDPDGALIGARPNAEKVKYLRRVASATTTPVRRPLVAPDGSPGAYHATLEPLRATRSGWRYGTPWIPSGPFRLEARACSVRGRA